MSSVPEANLSARSAAAVWLILGTACRVGEAMTSRWEHMDVEKRTWFLPDTKNQRHHLIHLSDFALEQVRILSAWRQSSASGETSPWVFPNNAGDGHVCVKTFGKQLADRQRSAGRRLQNRTKKADALTLPGGRWTAHDLRRTAATLMAGIGVSTDVIDECLNHKLQSKVSRVYIKDRRLREQADAFDRLGAYISRLLAQRSSDANVVCLRAAA